MLSQVGKLKPTIIEGLIIMSYVVSTCHSRVSLEMNMQMKTEMLTCLELPPPFARCFNHQSFIS